jgi:aspartate kinase
VNAVQHGATQTSFALTHDSLLFPELLVALQADFRVVYNDNLVLYTVRHPDDEAIHWVRAHGDRILEQSTRTTFQALVRA